ncbi:MAG TPA: hypothetical protein VLE45_02090, partial [Burkholderiaceae bacterium]|nr:hypothetical protein [Burkholderiaceae bacterium]
HQAVRELQPRVRARLPQRDAAIARVIGFRGALVWDAGKPDGAPRKLLDVSRLRALGWQARIELEPGLRDTYRWFLEHHDEVRV